MDAATIFLVQVTVVIGLPPLLWYVTPLGRLTPLAVVQKACGIALGPSLLGRFAPDAFEAFFSPGKTAAFGLLANFAVILFAFVIGAHLDRATLAGSGRRSLEVGLGSFLLPTALGAAIGWEFARFYPAALGPQATRLTFALAVGACVGVTALPMLGSVLRDLRLLDHPVGQLALGSAVLSDTAVWLMLAGLVTGRAHMAGGRPFWLLAAGGCVYLGAMFLLVRPLLARVLRLAGGPDQQIVVVALAAFLSALTTQLLGLHFILGAFVAGAAVPGACKGPALARLETVTASLLMPFFFLANGLCVFIDPSVAGFSVIVLVTLAAAMFGKIAGTILPARRHGESWRNAFAVGALLQSKGVLVYVALTILLGEGIISREIFSALALMALLADLSCVPLVRLTRMRAGPLPAAAAAPQAGLQGQLGP